MHTWSAKLLDYIAMKLVKRKIISAQDKDLQLTIRAEGLNTQGGGTKGAVASPPPPPSSTDS